MATPTRSQVASTPRNPINTTPSRTNASPRTNLGVFGNKTIAGKSPAVKTPASIYSHAHKMSISSHPTTTPLATSTLQDDMMNINTPALLASMGQTGLTPLPSNVDGLGIVANLPGPQDQPTGKNTERERHERLKEVEDLFKSRTAGRGVTRKHIETLASINRFDTGFDEDMLFIAGQRRVDLEISFDSEPSDTVRKVSLKLNLPDQEDAIYQKDASRVLRENLRSAPSELFPWHDLSDFSANLAYLSRLEHVNTDTNCFRVMDNLYDIFRQIWAEEKKRMKWRHDQHHLCKSNIGQPLKDVNGRLGVRTIFWITGSHFYAREEPKTDIENSTRQGNWAASFAIQTGPPAMTATQKWLGEEILTSTANAEDIFQESAVDKPAWQDSTTSGDQSKQEDDTMKIDQPEANPADTVNMHLICDIEPTIFVPLHIAQSLNEQIKMLDLHQHHLSTFQQTLCTISDDTSSSSRRWTRTLQVPNRAGEYRERSLSYVLYSTGSNVIHPLRKLNFAHPRQYSEVLPVLRQYALINNLLRSIQPNGKKNTPHPQIANAKVIPIRGQIVKRSNKPQLDRDVKAILNTSDADGQGPLKIDVRLDSTSSPIKSCRLELRAPLTDDHFSLSAAARTSAKRFLVIMVDVLLNGVVEIISIDGVDIEKQKLDDLKKRLARVVRASEDVGIVVTWLLRELQTS